MEAVFSNLDTYWLGFKGTLELLAVGGLGALLLGTFVALLRISPIASLRGVAVGFTELMRNTPLTLVFFFIIVVLPALQIRIPTKLGAFIALSLYTSAFVAEAIRSGINGVPIGQAEAARSVGLNFGQTVQLIILPQALRVVIPPLINTFIGFFKDTSLVLIIGIFDFLNTANQALVDPNWAGFPGEVYLFAAFVYFIFCYSMSRYSKYLEVELNKGTRR